MDEAHTTITQINERYNDMKYFKSLIHTLELKLDKIESHMSSMHDTLRELSLRQNELSDRLDILEQYIVINDEDNVSIMTTNESILDELKRIFCLRF